MRLLIVDDNEIFQNIIQKYADRWHCDADVISDGAAAVEKLVCDKAHYDLCVMKIQLPILDGVNAARLIRKSGNQIPIIGVSIIPGKETLCFEAGMNDYLLLPFTGDQLYQKIQAFAIG